MKRFTLAMAAACAAVMVLLPVDTIAQATLGTLTGVVRDASDAVLPGASVALSNPATGATQEAVTNERGQFLFSQLPVGTYQVKVSLPGFKTQTYDQVVINVGQEYGLSVQLSVGGIEEAVLVVAGASIVSTTTPEVTTTVQQQQVLDIPLANRDITNLIKLQAGVAGISNRANTVINGGRPTWTQITLDGINIQDNFIRVNGLDFLPNRPTSDNVAEFSITTSVSGADAAGGATAIRMVTPSGSNTLRGSVYEFWRDSKFAANSYFNNAATPRVPKAELSRHQFGGRAGGPVARNRLFYFANYEGFRQKSQTAQNITIPANADFLDGVYRYVGLDGVARSVNVMQLAGLPIDQKLRTDFLSKLPAASNVNNRDVGNSTAANLLNTAGYRFNQTDLLNRNQLTARVDFNMTQNHKFEGSYNYSNDIDDRTDLDFVTPDRPLVYTLSKQNLVVGAWRAIFGDSFQNEARYGANLSVVSFNTDWDYSAGVLYNTNLAMTNPVGGFGTAAGFQAQGRNVNTFQFSDNATLVKGSHQLQMGGSWQRNRVNPYNFAGQYPVVSFAFSSAAPANVQLTSARFPGGISAADLASANAMTAMLGGVVSSVAQTFQVRDATSGFVKGIPSDENYALNDIALYLQDNWRWKPNFTVRAGLKWEYYSPLREDANLGFLPVVGGRSIDTVMLDPATRITFADGDFYKKDLNNIGPTIGFAWDVTGDGRTAVRGGYSLSFVNEDTATVARAVGRGNPGLTTGVTLSNQYTTVAAGVPAVATPAFLSTRTLADQMALSATGVLWGIDPNITAPQVHQVSVGIQRELGWGTAVEARYVGTFGRDIWRGTDYNQINISPAFLADFNRARSNGFAAQAAGLAFSPAFNAAVPGSQALTVLPTFGLLTNATVVTSIQQNEVARLADFYVSSRVAGALTTFMQNPGIYASQVIANGAFSDYNALQLEARRQFRNGFFGQMNYTLSNTNTNSAGTGQNRFEPFMDSARPELSEGRSIFHQTHVLNVNAIYELPFGQGRRWANRGGVINAIVGDWQIGSIVALQSGSPLSIFSGRGSFNRVGRSDCNTGGVLACNTAFTALSAAEIKDLLGVYKAADGRVYWIDPKVIDPVSGRAVGADNAGNTAGFAGQVFFNPAAGQVGNLEALTFDGPSQFRMDLALSKRFSLPGRYRLEFKGEAFNLFNTPSFFIGDMNINSTTFGRLTSVNVGARVVQVSARFDF